MGLSPILHGLEVSPNLSGVIIKKSKLIETGGLPDIFESRDVAYPNDVRLDSFELYSNFGRRAGKRATSERTASGGVQKIFSTKQWSKSTIPRLDTSLVMHLVQSFHVM